MSSPVYVGTGGLVNEQDQSIRSAEDKKDQNKTTFDVKELTRQLLENQGSELTSQTDSADPRYKKRCGMTTLNLSEVSTPDNLSKEGGDEEKKSDGLHSE